MDGYLAPKAKSSVEVTFDEVMRDIRALGSSPFILIDRENTKQTGSLSKEQSEGVYVLEVVSERSQTLPVGRYLVARSKAKDAADTLIMMLLYEAARRTDTQVILVEGHFN